MYWQWQADDRERPGRPGLFAFAVPAKATQDFHKKERPMGKPIYGVGDLVVLRDGPLRTARMDGAFKILAVLPDSDGQVQYRVRSQGEGFDRRVSSSEIDMERSAKSKVVAPPPASAIAKEPWFKASSIKIRK
jgi:hypothetical protein